MTPEFIVIHTAAYRGPDCDAQEIDEWHRIKNKWREIGYHFVIIDDNHRKKADGTIEAGRSESKKGAHARGLNDRSIGICMIGHGDYNDFTKAQYKSLFWLVSCLMLKYNIPLENVIGHREINEHVGKSNRTSKTCPGTKVCMETLRERLKKHQTSQLLMARDNPDGHKLEQLAYQLEAEIYRKNQLIQDASGEVPSNVRSNNKLIMQKLREIKALQENSFKHLATLGKDTGPTGAPRIGS